MKKISLLGLILISHCVAAALNMLVNGNQTQMAKLII